MTDRRAIRWGAASVIVLAAAGLAGIPRARGIDFKAFSLFFEQFAAIEPSSLVVAGLFAAAILIAVRFARPDGRPFVAPASLCSARTPALLAVAVLFIAVAGERIVFHGYLFADDEFASRFQSLIFAHGQRVAHVDAAWCALMPALRPSAIQIANDCTWGLGFLPLHALIQAPFVALGIAWAGVPLVSAACVALVWSVARKVWPDEPTRALLSALFLATSTQVLFMSMSNFAMPTHLLFALAWLRLYVNGRRWSDFALPWVGALALGVHSPFPHILFVLPFILRYLRQRRLAQFGYVALAYAIGLAFWNAYLTLGLRTNSAVLAATFDASNAVAVLNVPRHIFSALTGLFAFSTSLHLSLLATWNSPLVLLLAVAAVVSWRELDSFGRDLVLSLGVAIVARLFSPTTQGEGWGYRYVYANLGNLVLLGAVGASVMARAVGSRTTWRMVAASVGVFALVQLPLRVSGVNRVVGPYRDGYAWLTSLPYDAVVYPSEMVLWGRQLVRNDPFLRNRPKIVEALSLTDSARARLRADTAKVRFITRAELRAHGLPRGLLAIGPFIFEP
jgi:hypothetical protein